MGTGGGLANCHSHTAGYSTGPPGTGHRTLPSTANLTHLLPGMCLPKLHRRPPSYRMGLAPAAGAARGCHLHTGGLYRQEATAPQYSLGHGCPNLLWTSSHDGLGVLNSDLHYTAQEQGHLTITA